MTTTTFSPAAANASSNTGNGIRAFITAWFKATPVYVVYTVFSR